MKKTGLILVAMLACAALAFTSCDFNLNKGEEGEYLVFFENYSGYQIIVNCTKATPTSFTLEGVATGAAPTTGTATFTSSFIRGHIIWTAMGIGTADQKDLINMDVSGLRVVFTNKD